ncbi:lipoyl(octanoyl) transferase LipB [Microbacterium binotii]|uniref:Octanoyltransferase n=1 Tax=Microbacterium binotii TaxID=462710 RepID=A0ABN3PDR6_9MICO
MLDVATVGFAPAFVPYERAWALQKRLHAEVVAGARGDTLLLLEHQAVYTAGTRTTPAERPVDGTPVLDVDRGGRITWHGPGQLVGYPIVRLPDPMDVVGHVRRLERVLIAAVAQHGVEAHQVPGRSGVWVEGEAGADKVAAIGVRVERGVTMHGFAVNCDNSLAPFRRIVPCGITDAGVTTLSAATGRQISPSALAATVSDLFRHEYAEVTA